jgi:GNAT superfamily N-acetyltransferase
MPIVDEVVFEDLKGDAVEKLAPYLKMAGMSIAYPHMADPVCAKVGNQIIGFAFAQLLPHWEPLWVVPEYRGTGVAEELARRALEKILKTGAQRILLCADNPFAEKLAMKYGFHAIPGKLYVREPNKE